MYGYLIEVKSGNFASLLFIRFALILELKDDFYKSDIIPTSKTMRKIDRKLSNVIKD